MVSRRWLFTLTMCFSQDLSCPFFSCFLLLLLFLHKIFISGWWRFASIRRRLLNSLVSPTPLFLPVRSFRSGSCPRDSLVLVFIFSRRVIYLCASIPDGFFRFFYYLHSRPIPREWFFLKEETRSNQEIHAGFERAVRTSRAIVFSSPFVFCGYFFFYKKENRWRVFERLFSSRDSFFCFLSSGRVWIFIGWRPQLAHIGEAAAAAATTTLLKFKTSWMIVFFLLFNSSSFYFGGLGSCWCAFPDRRNSFSR